MSTSSNKAQHWSSIRQGAIRIARRTDALLNENATALLAILVCLLAYLISVDAQKTLLGWDTDGAFLDPKLALHRTLSGWDFYESLGANNAPFAARIPVYAFESLLESAHLSPSIVQWIVTGSALMLLPFSMLVYAVTVFPRSNVIMFISAIAIFFNLYVALNNHTNPYLFFNAAIAAGPLIASCIIRLATRRTPFNMFFLVVSSLIVSIVGMNAAAAGIAFVMIVFFTAVGLSFRRIPLRTAALPLSAYILLNAFWLLPTAQHFIVDGAELVKSQYILLWGDSTLHAVSEGATPYNWVRMVGTWEWTHADAGGHGYASFSALYDSNPIWSMLSLILLLLGVIGLALRPKTAWPFAVMFAVMFFLMKGTAEPFGSLYGYLYHHVPGFKVFRDPYTKFGIGAIPCLAVLAAIGVESARGHFKGRWGGIFAGACAAAIMFGVEPYWNGDMFKRGVYMQNYYVNIPKAYTDLASYLNNMADQSGRALVFPFSPNLSYTALNWNFEGPDPLQYLIARPTVFEANGFADPFVNAVFSNVNTSVEALQRATDRAALRYVIVHHDVVREIYGADRYQDSEQLLRSAGAIQIKSFGDRLVLYEMPASMSRSRFGLLSVAKTVVHAEHLPSRLSFVLSTRHVVTSKLSSNYADPKTHRLFSVLALPDRIGLGLDRHNVLVPKLPAGGSSISSDLARLLPPFFFIDGQVFSPQFGGDLSPGQFPAAALNNLEVRTLRWQNVDQYVGPPGAPVYRIVPVNIEPGDHVYGLIYKAYSTSVTAGVSLRCCFPAHDQRLAPDAYPPLDGGIRAVAFRVSYPVPIVASLCIFGDASDLLTAEPAYVFTASVKDQRNISVPEVLGISPNASRSEDVNMYSVDANVAASDAPQLKRELMAYAKLGESIKGLPLQLFSYTPDPATEAATVEAGAPYADKMRVQISQPGVLIFAAAWNRGWIATMHGLTLEKLVVDGVFNGWYVPRGGAIDVVFAPRRMLWIGTMVSLSTLLLISILIVRFKLRR